MEMPVTRSGETGAGGTSAGSFGVATGTGN